MEKFCNDLLSSVGKSQQVSRPSGSNTIRTAAFLDFPSKLQYAEEAV